MIFDRMVFGMHHYITQYIEEGKHYAEAWIQVDVFGRCFCLWKKRIEVKHGK